VINIVSIDTARLRFFLSLIKDLLEPRFPEAKRSSDPRGANRKWPRWLIIALALLKNSLPFSWRGFTIQLQQHKALLMDFGAIKVPSTTSIYNAWSSIPPAQLENLVALTGKILSPKPQNVALDSTGFLFKGGSVWILLKWAKQQLKKTSRSFYKVHIATDLTSRAVLAIKLSKAPTHDLKIAWRLIKSIGKRCLTSLRKIYGDKAYTDKKLSCHLNQYQVQLIVEPRSNATDKGTNGFQDRNLRLYRNSPNLWKWTHKHGQKAIIERVFGSIKSNAIPLSARLAKNKRKQLIMKFFVYNFNLLLEVQNLR